MQIESRIPLLEELLGQWQSTVGADFDAYRNHIYRVAHFTFALHPCTDEDKEKIAVAGCFHDLGVWTDATLDYLPPSSRMAREYLEKSGRSAWTEEVTLMIDMHHKLRSFGDGRYPLVEAFRKADLVDVSMGSIRMGVSRADVEQVKAAFPNYGFHKRLVQLGSRWFLKHPLDPLPFVRW